jgi:hypothetical protein
MKLLLLSMILLGLGFAGIAIKIWAKKDGEFDGTCAGSNVRLKAEGITCGCGNEGGCKTNLDNLDNKEESLSAKSTS